MMTSLTWHSDDLRSKVESLKKATVWTLFAVLACGLVHGAANLGPGPGGAGSPIQPAVAHMLINIRDFGAAGNGTTSDTALIRAAIAALPERGGTIYFPAGVYLVDDQIVGRGQVSYVGDGPSSIIRMSNRRVGPDGTALSVPNLNLFYPAGISGGSDVVVEGLYFDGNLANQPTGRVIKPLNISTGSSRVTIRNCGFNGWPHADGAIYINGTDSGRPQKDILITGNSFTDTQIECVVCHKNCDGLVISHNTMVGSDTSREVSAAVDIEPSEGATNARMVVSDNIIQNFTSGIFVGGGEASNVSSMVIANNSISKLKLGALTHAGILSRWASRLTITGNTITDLASETPCPGISVRGDHGIASGSILISNNVIDGHGGDSGHGAIDVGGTSTSVITGVVISNNMVTNTRTGCVGISCAHTAKTTLTGNTIPGGPHHGIYLDHADGTTLTGNNLAVAFDAINGLASDRVLMAGNTLTGGRHGVNATGFTRLSLGADNAIEGGTSALQFGEGTTWVHKHLPGRAGWAPPTLATGEGAVTTVRVDHAEVGDMVNVSFTRDLEGCTLVGHVSAPHTVTVTLANPTGAPKTLASGTLAATVWK